MFFIYIILILLLLVYGTPIIRFKYERFALLFSLMKIKSKNKHFFYSFKTWYSLWGFNKGKSSDLLIALNDTVYILKFCGSFRKYTNIEIKSETKWKQIIYYPLPLLFIQPPFEKTINFKFNLLSEKEKLESENKDIKVETVYLLSPKPRNIEKEEGETNITLANGDKIFDTYIFSRKKLKEIIEKSLHNNEGLYITIEKFRGIQKIYKDF